ncbi:hypothetical protein C0991_011144 [Blastosporella zonata]|nr:hypothetical protein C0991_011144 [Blastosporella zonata]
MRRAQSVRNYVNTSIAFGADDLGLLREGDETNEDVLRRQLIDKDRENDKLQTQIQVLQAQIAQRPPLESVQQLEKEYKSLDLLLQGTQRENERCMAELERARTREKMLERELARLAGDNWQVRLRSLNSFSTSKTTLAFGQSSLDIVSSPAQNSPVLSSSTVTRRPAIVASSNITPLEAGDMVTRVEQVRMLILGMEQRLQVREEKLAKIVEKAESEGHKFEEQQQALNT